MVLVVDAPLRIPAGIAYFWGTRGDVDETLRRLCEPPRQAVLGPGLVAFVPTGHGAEVFDSALLFARSWMDSAGDGSARALVFPAFVEQRGDELRLLSDALVEDLRSEAPQVDGRSIYITGHAAREIELPWRFRAAPDYRGPSGRTRTLWAVAGMERRFEIWRNPRVLERPSPLIPVPAQKALAEALTDERLVRVVGPLGVGKSRLVAETVGRESPLLVARCQPALTAGPGLAAQMAATASEIEGLPMLRLGEKLREALAADWPSPGLREDRRVIEDALLEALQEAGKGSRTEGVTVLVDEAHRADQAERELIRRLSEVGGARVVLVGRPPSWLDGAAGVQVEVRPLDEETQRRQIRSLAEGLSIPEELETSLLVSSGGNAFAAEEGLHNLVRRRLLREHYGNFFYAGPKNASYLPTARFDRHLISEAIRLGGLAPCMSLASADRPVPLAALAGERREDIEAAIDRLCLAGVLTRDGDGRDANVGCASPAVREAFVQCLDQQVTARLREALATTLDDLSTDDDPWSRYRARVGTAGSAEALLEVMSLPEERRPDPQDLLQALEEELVRTQSGGGEPSMELDLLWFYLPMARTVGRVDHLMDQIERALELCHPSDPRRMALLALHSEESLVQGALEHAEETAVEGLTLARKQHPARQSILLLQLGKVLQRQDRHPEAKKLLLDLLHSIDPRTSPAQVATCHYHLGNIYLREEDYELALEHHQTALRRRRRHDNPTSIGQSLTALASLNVAIGNYSHSLELYREALETIGTGADPYEKAFPLVGIGRTLSRLGEYEEARPPLEEALDLRTRRADRLGIEISRLALARNDLDLGDPEGAEEKTRQVLFRMSIIGSRAYKADAESLLGLLLLDHGRHAEAFKQLEDAAHQHRQVGDEVACLFDEAHALEACITLANRQGIELRSRILGERLAVAPYPELGERLDLRLFEGWKWLQDEGLRTGDCNVPLERAFHELRRKTSMLEPERRPKYLRNVPENREILGLAEEYGLGDATELEGLPEAD